LKAAEITDTVLRSVEKDPKDFYLINYANADLVGHSGNLEATKKALEALDLELGRLHEIIVDDMDGTLFITGDHGNAEQKIDPMTGNPSPTHTTNPVPFVVVTKTPLAHAMVAQMYGLADIAPVILAYMGIPVPPEMTGSRGK
jgi:2,3-bisphosphoglycerate-independent phosphoglycerate mutase